MYSAWGFQAVSSGHHESVPDPVPQHVLTSALCKQQCFFSLWTSCKATDAAATKQFVPDNLLLLAGARFRLLLLAVQHCRQTQQHQRFQRGQSCPPHIAGLFERIMATALQTFRAPPAWYGKWSKSQARSASGMSCSASLLDCCMVFLVLCFTACTSFDAVPRTHIL